MNDNPRIRLLEALLREAVKDIDDAVEQVPNLQLSARLQQKRRVLLERKRDRYAAVLSQQSPDVYETAQQLRRAVEFYRQCPHCKGDGDEPHTDNDVCGPAPCRQCDGMGQGWDRGERAEHAIAECDRLDDPELPVVSRKTLATALGKVLAGYRPGDELWSKYDEVAVDYAQRLPVPGQEHGGNRNA